MSKHKVMSARRGDNALRTDFRDGHNIAQNESMSFIRQVRKWETRRKKLCGDPDVQVEPLAIRPMVIDDASYVLDSWANSYRRSQVTGPIEREVFNIEQRARINRLISRVYSRVFVACDQAQTQLIRGWICFEAPVDTEAAPVLHYVCVHPQFQLQGIGTALVNLCRKTAADEETHIWSTHETQPMRHIREKWNVLYNPYLLELPERKASK